MEASRVVDAGGGAGVAAAVASVAGLVDQLKGVVSPPPLDVAALALNADPLRDLTEKCLSGLEVLARVEAAVAAVKVRLVAAYAAASESLEGPAGNAYEASAREKCLVAEVAGVLTVGEGAASNLLGEAHALATSLPLALDALQAGTISWQHARVLADETSGLVPARVAALEAHFFDPDAPNPARGAAPGELVPSRFRRKVRAWRERQYPDSLEVRHALAVADRRMEYRPEADGMARISLVLPGGTACAIWNKATAIARGLQGPEEARTMPQLRADAGANLLLGETGADLGKLPSPKADVMVTVPVFSLLGATDEPGEVDGFGPVPASVARTLVGEGAGSLYRLLVDPRDGAPLEIGRTSYRLPESLKRWLRLRDGTCTFPGCSNHTADNENDHLTAWEHGGATGVSNLGQVCPKHHRLKHQSRWTPTPASKDEPPGWTSPTGRHYPAEQPDRIPPVIPPDLWPDSSTSSTSSTSEAPLPEIRTGPPAAIPPFLLPVPSSGEPSSCPPAPLPVISAGPPPVVPSDPSADPPTGLQAAQIPHGPENPPSDPPTGASIAPPGEELSLLEQMLAAHLAA
ncbi:DUF222 domain-containing protein [Pseudarthrobacter enclensis]|uniref:HNH endonuclease signature motif containing protein n=1 Tax=Pseudarthrobacter enclensis TaxID=993070 RepID=UPI003EE27D20